MKQLLWMLVFAINCTAQGVGGTASFGGTASMGGSNYLSSSVAITGNTACNNGTTNAPYSCTIPAVSGNLAVLIVEDADNPAVPTTLPSGLGTAIQDGTYASSAGRLTVYHVVSPTPGATSVTITPTSGHSSVNVRVYSGMDTSSPLVFISSALTTLTAVTTLYTNTESASQTDLAIAVCGNGTSATRHYAAGAGYNDLMDFPQPNDASDWAAEDAINAFTGQWTGVFSADSSNYFCMQALYKAASSNAVPNGNAPSFYTDFEGSTSGTTVTPAMLTAATHGGNCTWSISGAAFIVSSLGQKDRVNIETVNGFVYGVPEAGGLGLRYDPGLGGAYGQCQLLVSEPTVTAGVWWKSPATLPDTTTHSFITLQGVGAADYAMVALAAGQTFVVCETLGGDSAQQTTITANTWYRATVKYVAGGTHTCRLYDINGSQVGSDMTHAATGTNNVDKVLVGNAHGGAGISTNYAYLDNMTVDVLNSTFPLLP